jgi:hypothetical protein
VLAKPARPAQLHAWLERAAADTIALR